MLNRSISELSLQQLITKTPHHSGCYLFKDKTGVIIYVGKAQNLKKRISSHFQDPQNNYFYQQIDGFSTIITNNVKEALILEQNLIKKHQPRFNVLLKDNHYYPYLEITNEKNPCYKIVRKINFTNSSEYFGPFPDGSKAHEILQLLERLFPLAKCKGNLGKPCFYYTINQCSGHCWKTVDKSYYKNIKKEVRKFFRGQTQEIKKKIKKSLQKNIVNLAFEVAQKEKKILDSIDFFTSKQSVEFLKEENCDFLGVYEKENVISFSLFIYRYGKLATSKEALFPIWNNNSKEICETYLYQFYRNNLPPQTLYVSEKLLGLELLGEEFGFLCESPKQGQKKEALNLANQNARQAWLNNSWNEFQQVNKSKILEEMSNFLSISIPHHIECLDVSNLYKQDVVAGFLVFLNGEKKLSKSRLYKITKSKQESDISRIKVACLNHYQNYSLEKLPKLVIVDGGKEQVKAVQQALKELKLEAKTNVIGLVKDKNHYTAKVITNELKELNFGKNEKIKNFLTNCQEEVHYYVINFHRKLHRFSVLKH